MAGGLYSPRGVTARSAADAKAKGKKKKTVNVYQGTSGTSAAPSGTHFDENGNLVYSPRGARTGGSSSGSGKMDEATGTTTSPRGSGTSSGGKMGEATGGGPAPGGRRKVPPLQPENSQVSNSAFGQQYATQPFMNDIFSNPETLATSWLQGQGVDPLKGGGLPAVYQDLAQLLPQLFVLTQGTQGGQGSAAGVGINSFLDYVNQFLNQYSQPGSGTVSPDIINNLFSNGDNSLLSNILNDPSADPSQQADALLGMLGAGLGASLPGPIANAYLHQAQAMGQQFANNQWKGGKGTFADLLKDNGFADIFNF